MRRPDLIVIGASLGGLRALQTVLGALPAGLAGTIVIVQHRQPHSNQTLAALLQQRCALPVLEAEDKLRLEAGRVYLAPPDYQLLVEASGHFALSTEAPVNFSRPSIDVLFESAAEAYDERVVGVVLSGANADGAYGLGVIRAHGGLTLAQDPRTAEAAAMPRAAIEAKAVDQIMPLKEIGPFLAGLLGTAKKGDM